MKKYYKSIWKALLVGIAANIIFASCSTDDDPTPAQTVETQLIDGLWRTEASILGIFLLSATFDFQDNDVVSLETCSPTPTDCQTSTGVWELINNDESIIIRDSPTMSGDTLDIVSLTSDTLIVSSTGGTDITYVNIAQ